MGLPIVIAVLAVVLLFGLLYFEAKENTTGKLLTKTPLSCLFIVTALLMPQTMVEGYVFWLMTGLVFCLGGDVFLALPSKKTFMLGLVSFLLGHVFYILAFSRLAPLADWITPWMAVVLVVSGTVFIWLKPHLGKMLIPVLAYVIVITLMVIGALGAWLVSGGGDWGRRIVFAGAVLFYVSDLFVARQRFVTPGNINRNIGLPTYYGGQFLLAISIGLV